MSDLYYALRNRAFTKPFRSRKFLSKVKAMSCIRCGRPADDPHHIFGSRMSLKSDDRFTVPVCRECHEFYESHPGENQSLVVEWIQKVALPLLEQV